MHNRVVRSPELFLERMLSLKGLVQRPLSVLSFTLNYQISGEASWSYHAVNLIIHLGNISPRYWIAASLAIPTFIAAAIFPVHLLSTAYVVQIFGRLYSLGTLFMCCAIYHLFLADQ